MTNGVAHGLSESLQMVFSNLGDVIIIVIIIAVIAFIATIWKDVQGLFPSGGATSQGGTGPGGVTGTTTTGGVTPTIGPSGTPYPTTIAGVTYPNVPGYTPTYVAGPKGGGTYIPPTTWGTAGMALGPTLNAALQNVPNFPVTYGAPQIFTPTPYAALQPYIASVSQVPIKTGQLISEPYVYATPTPAQRAATPTYTPPPPLTFVPAGGTAPPPSGRQVQYLE